MLVIDFKDHLDTQEIIEAIQRIRENIKRNFHWFGLLLFSQSNFNIKLFEIPYFGLELCGMKYVIRILITLKSIL